jgi:hypothetical protein
MEYSLGERITTKALNDKEGSIQKQVLDSQAKLHQ